MIPYRTDMMIPYLLNISEEAINFNLAAKILKIISSRFPNGCTSSTLIDFNLFLGDPLYAKTLAEELDQNNPKMPATTKLLECLLNANRKKEAFELFHALEMEKQLPEMVRLLLYYSLNNNYIEEALALIGRSGGNVSNEALEKIVEPLIKEKNRFSEVFD